MRHMICELDAEGQSLTWRAADLKARFMLLNRADWLYENGHKHAVCTLIHAMVYLEDRLAYELYPWPKNCVLVAWGEDAKAGGDDQ